MAPVRQSRQFLLSLVLLAVLAVSVLAAWVMVRVRQAPIARGQAILRQMRDRTLQEFWGDKPDMTWLLTREPGGQPVGYMARARWRTDEGYEGAVFATVQGHRQAERWSIDPSASAGTYVGDIGWMAATETFITLSAGRVTVRQGRSKPVAKAAPGNYIPEGLMWLVVAEVSKTDKSAVFSMVFNAEAIQLDDVNFTTITMTPLGDGNVRVRADLLAGRIDQTYQVDSQGNVVRVEDNADHSVSSVVDVKELAKLFPEATELVPFLQNRSDHTTQPQAPEISPTSFEL